MNGVAAVAIAMTMGGCAEIAVKKLHNTQPTGSEFNKALAGEYLAFAKNELNVQVDELDARYFAQKGQAAAEGADVQPEETGKRRLMADYVPVFERARARLLHALNNGGRDKQPALAARAQASFDRWMEEAEENFQTDLIEDSRLAFYRSLRELEYRLDDANPKFDPQIDAPKFTVFFDTGSAKIKDKYRKVLLEAGRIYYETVKDTERSPQVRVYVYGYCDKSGSKKLNERLSKKRVKAVFDELIRHGIDEQHLMEGEGKGAVDGPLHDQQNRRVDIVIDNR